MVPRPGRHHDVIRAMANVGFPTPITGEQGFVTDIGRFVDRERAAVLAKRAQQIIKKTGPSDILFSEDVW
jgi:hypothetical protein